MADKNCKTNDINDDILRDEEAPFLSIETSKYTSDSYMYWNFTLEI